MNPSGIQAPQAYPYPNPPFNPNMPFYPGTQVDPGAPPGSSEWAQQRAAEDLENVGFARGQSDVRATAPEKWQTESPGPLPLQENLVSVNATISGQPVSMQISGARAGELPVLIFNMPSAPEVPTNSSLPTQQNAATPVLSESAYATHVCGVVKDLSEKANQLDDARDRYKDDRVGWSLGGWVGFAAGAVTLGVFFLTAISIWIPVGIGIAALGLLCVKGRAAFATNKRARERHDLDRLKREFRETWAPVKKDSTMRAYIKENYLPTYSRFKDAEKWAAS